ncbi:MarR family winged helix-turn-helix transcriptional regulator [Marinactinospora rubrisoli]|uniref:MarR family winged helix-turn-helix transcriptional regulator n=1 Tax=Marinactinospora rubrisoli TaxID=2715399 RepID=A0ABW2KCQ2_9ACTN
MTALRPSCAPVDLTWLLTRAARRMRAELDTAAREHELAGIRDWVVLTALTRSEGRTQLQLGRDLGVDRTTLTLLVDRLEGDGLVVRRHDLRDRRVRIPHITDAGRDRQARVARTCEAAEARLLSGFTAQERQALRSLLLRLAEWPEEPGEAGR